MFKGLFGKRKENQKSLTSEGKALNRTFSAELKDKIESSTLQLMTHDLYMHYWSDNTITEATDPEWKNQAIFFWQYTEPFEKQSLPPNFKEFQKKLFIVNELPESVSVLAGKVIPWFGMPGGGTKYSFSKNDQPVEIKDLIGDKALSYVEIIQLTDSTSDLLSDTENHYFLINSNIITFENGKCYHRNKVIAFADAVEIGGLELIKIEK
jgi:hypothetical protein